LIHSPEIFLGNITISLINFFVFDLDIRRRIELIQEFEMPTASSNILVSGDKEYIMATGKCCTLVETSLGCICVSKETVVEMW